ncbi:uncharacterized protein METZ01_LOCUS84577 [marine metagenome]|uniref:Uncharacterized protein n=1 Tax=marine metagenome TaxID=408172 RepID=A0A381UXN1_9ZZZZ|tara:strand:+ start:551 stop:799 length:249 start_codon:yes stop_codon:yes gene_type:complete
MDRLLHKKCISCGHDIKATRAEGAFTDTLGKMNTGILAVPLCSSCKEVAKFAPITTDPFVMQAAKDDDEREEKWKRESHGGG